MKKDLAALCGSPKITLVDTETSPLTSIINHATISPEIVLAGQTSA